MNYETEAEEMTVDTVVGTLGFVMMCVAAYTLGGGAGVLFVVGWRLTR